jgi:hypothetical protein
MKVPVVSRNSNNQAFFVITNQNLHKKIFSDDIIRYGYPEFSLRSGREIFSGSCQRKFLALSKPDLVDYLA